MFADLIDQGYVYRGKKPVYWSIPCHTALAEAEVEYQDHVSPSVFVKFKVMGEPNTFVLIWTTTPWTLPANLAVAFNSKLQYSEIQVEDESYILSNGLLDALVEKMGWDNFQITRSLDSDQLEQIEYEHPFCDRSGKLHDADFVDDSTGTGFVHIAPGHGLEDYGLGMRVIATRGSRREGPAFVSYVGLSHEAADLASEADVVINAAPLTSSTMGMFDADFFSAMKSTAYFINIGRGKSVVTSDLTAALQAGEMAGDGVDVMEHEPLKNNLGGSDEWSVFRLE